LEYDEVAYADFVVSQCSGISVEEEFQAIIVWTCLIKNVTKTKKTVDTSIPPTKLLQVLAGSYAAS